MWGSLMTAECECQILVESFHTRGQFRMVLGKQVIRINLYDVKGNQRECKWKIKWTLVWRAAISNKNNWENKAILNLRCRASNLFHTFISSRLDYIQRLQKVQNKVARILIRTSRTYDHVSPIVRALHWLIIRTRVHIKILILAYKCVNDLALSDISELLEIHTATDLEAL